MPIRLMICDDHEVIRTGLASLLAGTDIEIVAEAANSKDALKLAAKDKPDIILLDIRLPDSDGLATLEKLAKSAGVQSHHALDVRQPHVHRPRSGAGGQRLRAERLFPRRHLRHDQGLAAGESPSRTGELKKIASTMKVKQAIDDDDVPLTQRETQVLRHVALGLSNKEIGKSLEISVETVKEHVQNILRKIAVNDRTQAAVWAVRKGLV